MQKMTTITEALAHNALYATAVDRAASMLF
jgi:hypothetical protein